MNNITGTSGFIHCQAFIQMHFPIGADGKARVCCDQCLFYRNSTNRCGITMTPCFDARRYVGNDCPFMDDLTNYFSGGNNDG